MAGCRYRGPQKQGGRIKGRGRRAGTARGTERAMREGADGASCKRGPLAQVARARASRHGRRLDRSSAGGWRVGRRRRRVVGGGWERMMAAGASRDSKKRRASGEGRLPFCCLAKDWFWKGLRPHRRDATKGRVEAGAGEVEGGRSSHTPPPGAEARRKPPFCSQASLFEKENGGAGGWGAVR